MTEPCHIAVVLAAGGSRRLGFPKQLLRRNGETLLHRAVRLARETQPERLLVVLGAQHMELEPTLRDLDCEALANPDWERGLSSSLRCAARALSAHHGPTLLLACDQPALEREHLQRLLALARQAASGCAATPHGEAVGVPALVTASLLRQGEAAEGDRGLRDALNALPRDSLGVLAAPELGFDLDTPDDLQQARALGWIDPE